MKALHVGGPGEVSVVDIADPEPAAGEVLVRVERAALCATDRKMVQRGLSSPLVPGHETVGWLPDGTLVGVHPDVGCGQCRHCRSGGETRCPGKCPVGVKRDGGLAEWVTVREDHAVPLNDLDPAMGPLLEPLACCLHATACLDASPGTPALVSGGGVMGILNSWALQASGCTVVLVEPDGGRRELARDLGIDAAVPPGDAAADALGARPRIAVVTVPDGRALSAALDQVEVGGAVHAFASIPGDADVDANVVHSRHLRLVGTTGSNLEDYQRAYELAVTGRVPLHRLPRAEIPLAEVPEWLRGGGRPGVLKAVVDPKGA